LPSLQREVLCGNPTIEAFWDSVFRGYPVGAILTKDVDDNRNLLDGQQRYLLHQAILIHLNNNEDFLMLNIIKPSIWVDIAP
jgi:uncharacterized protein with ParB-like and HNH nuclease domain